MLNSRGLLTMFIGVCACLGSVSPAGAVIRFVDGDAAPGGDGLSWGTAYNGLSDALAAAQPGDQVWVAAGRYVGNFTLALDVALYGGFAGTETELIQRDWRANPTILDGNSSGSVVTAPSGATATTQIDGFTITNGVATYGGGLYLWNSSPAIANNTITGNRASYGGGLYLTKSSPRMMNNSITGNRGGGLYLRDSSPTIANNTITGNTGGGLYLRDSSPRIANNIITGNRAGSGGGLYLQGSSPTIANNTIMGNSAVFGGGLYLVNSSPTIANNTITGNSASFEGGGLYLWYSSPTVANNTITGNSAYDGGGLYLEGFCSAKIANTIVAFNSSGISRSGTSGTPTLRFNCVYGNTEYDYSNITDPTGTNGNISADPLFADLPYGNAHIQPDSPCVDGGNNADAFGDSDMDGESRIQPLGGVVDIGADESDGRVWAEGPYTIVRVSLLGDDANNGASWTLAKRTVQAGIDAGSALGGEVWVQAGTYEERITLQPYAYVYGGFAGGEDKRDERDWSVHVTTLDGQQQGSVVTARAGHGVSAIDGFTITDGSAPFGGGLFLFYSSPTIANNTITGNSTDNGGGLYLSGSSPTIVNNTITGNSADDGGGLYLNGSSPTIVNSTIAGNSAANDGGGLYLSGSSPTIVNNTITGNSATGHGGGLFLDRGSPTIANTIVAFNSSGIYRSGTFGTPAVWYNCVYGNTAYNYSNLTNPTGTNGNISADPLFVRNPDDGGDGWGDDPSTPAVDEGPNDDFGDLQLLSGSPCIDAGDNEAVPGDTADLDGDGNTTEPLPFDLGGSSRFVDDPLAADTGRGPPPVVDMGAYEFPAAPVCGDGVVDSGEECDDGNSSNNDDCLNTCEDGTCGDGFVWNEGTGTEECDDGPGNSDSEPDACRTNCVAAHCCDGVEDSDEECDTGPAKSNTEPDACRMDCRQPSCGDGVVDSGEECDDGGTANGDGCDKDCIFEVCGNAVVQFGEECDDGGESNTCDGDCTLAECGDGTLNITAGEECDDGNTSNNDDCLSTCENARCGDSFVWNEGTGAEECDDGDTNEQNDCTNACENSACGDGILWNQGTGTEDCDNGADNSDTEPDACRTDCMAAGCGDGVVDAGEDCDDGNTDPNDGCDPGCHFYVGDHCLMPFGASLGTNLGANTSFGADDREASCQPDSNKDAWFAYTAPCTATHLIRMEGTVLEPTNDTVLSVYNACNGNEIGCDDDGGAGELSELTFKATADMTYYFRVAGVGDNVGQIVLHISTVGRCIQRREPDRCDSGLRR